MATQSCESNPCEEADFGKGCWTGLSAIFLILNSDEKEGGECEKNEKKQKNLGEIFSPSFQKEMRLAYVVVLRNQASVNKINNHLITFNVS